MLQNRSCAVGALAAILLGLCCPALAGLADDYAQCRTLAIDHTRVSGTTTLADFPVLISATLPFLKTTANGGYVNSASGFDIAFASDEAGAVPLDHDIERYVAATGEIIVWVRVPTLRTDVDTLLYMFFGNPEVTSSTANPSGVWGASHQVVYHLHQNPAATAPQITDASAAANHASTVSMTAADSVAGIIGNALRFEGGADYVIRNPVAAFPATAITNSFWIKTTDAGDAITSYASTGSDNDWLVYKSNALAVYVATQLLDSTTAINDGGWHHVVTTWRASDGQTQIFKNGVRTFVGNQATGSAITGGGALVLGQDQDSVGGGMDLSQAFAGLLDEFRVANVVRSADWIATEYNNQLSPASFVSFQEQPGRCRYWRAITVDPAKVSGASDLLDFPLLVSVTDAALKHTSYGGHMDHINGHDIQFSADRVGNSLLDFDLERYTPSTGELIAHVRVPSLSTSQDTVIYLRYGNPDALTSQANPAAVWNSDYQLVWHLNESPASSAPQVRDSTANANHAYTRGGMSAGNSVAARIGQGLSFDGNDDYVVSYPFGGAEYYDDFSGNLSAYTHWQETWTTSGGYASDDTNVNAGAMLAVPLSATRDDFAMETTVQNSDDDWAGLFFRASDATHFYAGVYRIQTASIHLYKSDGSPDYSTWTELATTPLTTALNTPYTIRVTAAGNRLSCSVAGTSITAIDSTFTTGRMGLFSGWNQPKASFDYLRITPLVRLEQLTAECWMKSSDTTKGGTMLSGSNGSTEHNEFILYNYQSLELHTKGILTTSGVAANNGQWNHLACTWRNSDGLARIYKNGVQVWSATLLTGGTVDLANFLLGQEQDQFEGGFSVSQAFLGTMDEVRLSSVAQSGDWVATTYANQSAPSTFFALGTEESNQRPTAPANPSPQDGGYVANSSPLLSWTAASDPDGETVSYFITVADNPALSNPAIDMVATNQATQYQLSNFAQGQWYWQVWAFDGTEYNLGSALWSFTIDLTAPDEPTITSISCDLTTNRIAALYGTGENGSTLTVYQDGSVVAGSTVWDGNGNFTFTPAAQLTQGGRLQIRSQDMAGHDRDSRTYVNSFQSTVNAATVADMAYPALPGKSLQLGPGSARHQFRVALRGGMPATITAVMRKNSAYGSGPQPRITLTGPGITGTGFATAAMADVADSWQTLSVTATPNADGIATLTVESFSSNAEALAWIDQIDISQ